MCGNDRISANKLSSTQPSLPSLFTSEGDVAGAPLLGPESDYALSDPLTPGAVGRAAVNARHSNPPKCLERRSLLASRHALRRGDRGARRPPRASLVAYLLTKCHREKRLHAGCSSTTVQAEAGSG